MWKLEQKKTEAQAGNTLTDMKEFQLILRRVSEVGKSKQVLDVALTVTQAVGDMLKLFVLVFSVSATPEQDRKFRESIMQSADQSQRVIDTFNKMMEELKDFRETKEWELLIVCWWWGWVTFPTVTACCIFYSTTLFDTFSY